MKPHQQNIKSRYLALLHWVYGDKHTEAVWEDSYIEILDHAIGSLPLRYAAVIRHRVDGLTLKETAELTPRAKGGIRLGVTYSLDGHVTRERVRQMEARALRMLRHPNRLTLNRYIQKKYLCETEPSGEMKSETYDYEGTTHTYSYERKKCKLCGHFDDDDIGEVCPAKQPQIKVDAQAVREVG